MKTENTKTVDTKQKDNIGWIDTNRAGKNGAQEKQTPVQGTQPAGQPLQNEEDAEMEPETSHKDRSLADERRSTSQQAK